MKMRTFDRGKQIVNKLETLVTNLSPKAVLIHRNGG